MKSHNIRDGGTTYLFYIVVMLNWDLDNIKAYGFEGFYKISQLIEDWKLIPDEPGVYMILKTDTSLEYLKIGTGGQFKNRNPNVAQELLATNWVDNSIVMNIGQAGGIKGDKWSNETLRDRLKKYFKFGQGKPVAHWGGRYIWQLEDNKDLICCWKTLSDMIIDPRKEERELIKKFKVYYNKRPFANLKD